MADGRFFDDEGMDFAVRCVLSGVRAGMAEVGEVLAVATRVTDGDAESWFGQWAALGRRLVAVGDAAAVRGHRQSAWGAHLRAANYLACAGFWVPATDRPERWRPTWDEHRAAWDAAVDEWPTPARAVDIPFAGSTLPGHWFLPGAARWPGSGPAPVVVLVGGIDAPISDATMTGLGDGVDRGYAVLCLELPGQGAAFLRRGLALRPDAQAALGAALDWLDDEHPGAPTCLMGVSHGSLFAARAAAHLGGRVDALVLDPGVLRLTADDLEPVRADQRPPDADRAAYALTDTELDAIACPTYVADPEAPMGFVGQSAELTARWSGRGSDVVHDLFTSAEGAGLDCEIGAPQVRNQRVYDWLDERLGARTGGPGTV